MWRITWPRRSVVGSRDRRLVGGWVGAGLGEGKDAEARGGAGDGTGAVRWCTWGGWVGAPPLGGPTSGVRRKSCGGSRRSSGGGDAPSPSREPVMGGDVVCFRSFFCCVLLRPADGLSLFTPLPAPTALQCKRRGPRCHVSAFPARQPQPEELAHHGAPIQRIWSGLPGWTGAAASQRGAPTGRPSRRGGLSRGGGPLAAGPHRRISGGGFKDEEERAEDQAYEATNPNTVQNTYTTHRGLLETPPSSPPPRTLPGVGPGQPLAAARKDEERVTRERIKK